MIAFLLAALLAAVPTVNPGKAAGVYYVYDYKAEPAMTPAPEGYEPFYISHFARHGARYCTGQQDSLAVWLSKAEKAGVLTEFGAAFKERYDVAYESLRMRAGTLTEIGQDQHRTIARHMFSRFPEVFEGPTRAEAASTESGRVIMSMWSFLSSLQTLDDSLDITAEASSRFAPWLQPTHKLSPYFIKVNGGLGEYDRKAEKQFFSTTVPWKAVTGRLFTSPDVVTEVLHSRPDKFIRALHSVVSDTECTGDDPSVYDGLFTPEEFTAVGRYAMARYFIMFGNFESSDNLPLRYASFTLENIISMADADMASGSTQLRLRFGHDTGLMPLLAFLDVNGFGRRTASALEGIEIFPIYHVPMGCSVRLRCRRIAGQTRSQGLWRCAPSRVDATALRIRRRACPIGHYRRCIYRSLRPYRDRHRRTHRRAGQQRRLRLSGRHRERTDGRSAPPIGSKPLRPCTADATSVAIYACPAFRTYHQYLFHRWQRCHPLRRLVQCVEVLSRSLQRCAAHGNEAVRHRCLYHRTQWHQDCMGHHRCG